MGALYYSIVTITTLGYDDIFPDDDFGRFVVTINLAAPLSSGVTLLRSVILSFDE